MLETANWWIAFKKSFTKAITPRTRVNNAASKCKSETSQYIIAWPLIRCFGSWAAKTAITFAKSNEIKLRYLACQVAINHTPFSWCLAVFRELASTKFYRRIVFEVLPRTKGNAQRNALKMDLKKCTKQQ